MAVTNFKNTFQVNGSEYAYTTTDHAMIKPGESIPLYVPSLMPNVSSGSPKITPKTTKGTKVFKNSAKCKPVAKRVIKVQNYITPSFSRNQTWRGLRKEGSSGYYIPRKSKVVCTSLTSTPKKMNFGTDNV